VDEKILAVFIVDSNGKTSDLFIAPDAKIDRSFVETIKSTLNLKFDAASLPNQIGKHLWDISEYDKIRVIKIHESNHLIVVLAKSHTLPGDTADKVLGYIYESDEEQEEPQQPPCLF
jgi:hypothetical protein